MVDPSAQDDFHYAISDEEDAANLSTCGSPEESQKSGGTFEPIKPALVSFFKQKLKLAVNQ